MKKLISILLAVLMALSLGVVAFAEGEVDVDPTDELSLYVVHFDEMDHVNFTVVDNNYASTEYGMLRYYEGTVCQFTVSVDPGWEKSEMFSVAGAGGLLAPDEDGVYSFVVTADTKVAVTPGSILKPETNTLLDFLFAIIEFIRLFFSNLVENRLV